MDNRKVLNVIRYFKDRLNESGLDVEKIILFGSAARGTADEDSDIDIAVISKDFHGKDIFNRAPMIQHAEVSTIKKFLVPLDIVTMSPDDLENGNSLVAGFVRQGKVIYKSDARGARKKKTAAV